MTNLFAKPGDPLTPREQEVLYALADGQTTHQIADELNISTSTVTGHCKTMLLKLEANNRAHAVALAYHKRILTPMAETGRPPTPSRRKQWQTNQHPSHQ